MPNAGDQSLKVDSYSTNIALKQAQSLMQQENQLTDTIQKNLIPERTTYRNDVNKLLQAYESLIKKHESIQIKLNNILKPINSQKEKYSDLIPYTNYYNDPKMGCTNTYNAGFFPTMFQVFV